MSFHFSRSFWPAVVVGAVLFGGRAQAQLSADSPFVPPDNGAAAQKDPNAIEYRGAMSSARGTLYLLYDPVKKASTWVAVNEPGSPYAIKSVDAAHDTITLRVNGQELSLALKTPKVLASAQMTIVNGGPPTPFPIGGPVVLKPTPEDEQRRLQGVADEVRRRRLAREQAQQAGGTHPP